jgi:hypothetical protein
MTSIGISRRAALKMADFRTGRARSSLDVAVVSDTTLSFEW